MTSAASLGLDSRYNTDNVPERAEANASGVSWAAIAGGAFASAALSLILLSLGAGLGLSSVSPWSNAGASAGAIGTAGVVWLICMQIMSSAMGGYIGGRLRTKWTNTHSDEVYFRDTAHGFLVWSVGTVITATFLASSALSMVGSASNTADAMASKSRTEMNGSDSSAYYVDSLFRTERQGEYDEAARTEAGRIFANALRAKDISAPDRAYLSQMIAARTGVNQAEADKRVSDLLNDARLALDTARKATSHLLLWTFIALLIGAFSASYAATIGGRQRDHVKAI